MNREEPKWVGEIEQRPLPWRRQKLALFEDRLELTVEGWLDRFKIPFYLHNAKEDPDRVIAVPWLWLAFSIAALVGSALLWVFARSFAERALAGGLDFIGLISLAIQALRMRPRLVYAYKQGAQLEPHLTLAPDQPSPEEVKKFVDLVAATQKRHVEKLKSEQEGEGGLASARELERFAELRAKNALSEDEFTLVKAKLLNLKPRRIGF